MRLLNKFKKVNHSTTDNTETSSVKLSVGDEAITTRRVDTTIGSFKKNTIVKVVGVSPFGYYIQNMRGDILFANLDDIKEYKKRWF